MILFYIAIGMWIGAIITYINWWIPMNNQIKNLQESIHNSVNAKSTNNTEDNE